MIDIKKFNKEGDLSLIQPIFKHTYLAILGSRSILDYTKELLNDFFEKISNFKNIVVVSGGMYGVDLFCHNLALKKGLGTIVIIPSGIEQYKKTSLFTSLKKDSTSKLLILSRYEQFFLPRKYSYLERNRDIIDLSKVVFIAQSGIKSGSMYSGNYSLKTKKVTFCIPISLNNPQFIGNNYLISRGAKIYLDYEDIIMDLGIKNKISLNLSMISKYLPSSFDNLVTQLGEYEPDLIEKNLLEGILKGEFFLNNGEFFKKND